LRVCSCGALSLTRGRVCLLQLLLALASAVILRSESRGTRCHILLSQIRDFPFRRLLRLAGSRWRYSTPPPHGCTTRIHESTAFYNCHAALIEITASTGSITVFCESVVSETMYQFPSNGLVSKCLQLSASVSVESVFRNYLVSKNQSLCGNAFAYSFPRNDPCITIYFYYHKHCVLPYRLKVIS
jgi:hypothetical protein